MGRRRALALDAANKRLYVNLTDGVAALDDKGTVVARFPQRGYPAPDPRRDLVYIVANGVTMYDRAGKKLGTLASTFPEAGGFVPNIYAQAARANPVSGYLAVIVNNGVPGSSNGTFLRILSAEGEHADCAARRRQLCHRYRLRPVRQHLRYLQPGEEHGGRPAAQSRAGSSAGWPGGQARLRSTRLRAASTC